VIITLCLLCDRSYDPTDKKKKLPCSMTKKEKNTDKTIESIGLFHHTDKRNFQSKFIIEFHYKLEKYTEEITEQ
jgi:hypothetical protein